MTATTATADPHGRPWRKAKADSAYTGASRTHQDLAAYRPRSYQAQAAISGDRDLLNRRVQDLARNDGWASAGMDRLVDNIIGAGWRLNPRPDRRQLGLTADQVTEVTAQLKSAFAEWAEDTDCWCDAAQRNTFGGLLALAYRHRAMDGEALAIIQWLDRGGPWSTAVEIVDPDRLSQPDLNTPTASFRDGIELGGHGEPLAYHFRVAHPGDPVATGIGDSRHVRVPRFINGRRLVVHAFEATRAGQIRGVSMLSSVVKSVRMLGRYSEVELQAAVLNAVLGAFVTSPYDPKAIDEAIATGASDKDAGYADRRAEYLEQSGGVRLDGAMINYLYEGEKIEFTPSAHPNAVFDAFVRAALRNIASALGLTYEQLSADWSQVNYSSARAALLEIWRGFSSRASAFAAQFVQPIYVRVIEEAFARGRVRIPAGAPSFEEARFAWTRARWLMPGRGWVDPLKEAEAAGKRIALNLSSQEREAAEQGDDWEETLEQRAREIARAKELEQQHGLEPGRLFAGTEIAMTSSGGYPSDQQHSNAGTGA
jgi:lambda family phage portal protein